MNLKAGRGINTLKFKFQVKQITIIEEPFLQTWGGFFVFTIQQKEIDIKMKRISLEKIILDNEINPREHMNQEYIVELVEAIQGEATIPPIIVFKRDKKNYLSDGFHRYEAHRKAGEDKIEVEIREGGKRKAILFACGVNADHGLRRTNADKRFVVTKLLKDKKWGQWSDGKIAKRCAVSQAFVSKLKRELTQNGFEFPTSRLGANGKIIDTKNIGKRESSHGTGSTTKYTKTVKLNTADLANDNLDIETDDNSDVKKEKKKEGSNKRTDTKSNSTHKISKKEISQTAQQISNLSSRLSILNAMLQENERWTNHRTKKLVKIKNELDTAYTYLTEFIENIIENFN